MPRKHAKKRASSKQSLGSFRIIAGQWRSRRFEFEAEEGLRPTTDRVRETVFNWLSAHLPDAQVLDLFAGSGVLGIEALSRDAKSCLSLEINPKTCRTIKNIYQELKCNTAQVLIDDALAWLQRESTQEDYKNFFDLVFVDPPFRQDLLNQSLQGLESSGVLKNEALIYVEAEQEMHTLKLPNNWTLLKEKTMGQVIYRLFRRQSAEH